MKFLKNTVAQLLLATFLKTTILAAAGPICALSNGQAADLVQGQPNFTLASINSGTPASGVTMNRPRKIFSDGTRLFVADTENNRVLIYNTLPTTNTQAPDLVLGQANQSSVAANRGATVAADTMDFSHSVYFDGTRLYVADYHNNRVLIWNSLPTVNGQAADLVLGQADFTSKLINRTGSTTTPSAGSLYWPAYVWGDGTRVVVADAYNQRVLIWNSFPTVNGQNADVVVGQSTFTTNTIGCNAASLNYTHQASIEGGKLIVTDTNNHRYLIFNTVPTSNGASADVVIGQNNMTSCSANGTGVGQTNVSWAVGYTVDASGALWIADYGNHRVLRYNQVPTSNGAAATLELGQADFSGISINRTGSTTVAAANSLYLPYGVVVAGGYVWVADMENNRVLRYSCPVATPTPTAFSTPCQAYPNVPACSWPSATQPGDLLVTMKQQGIVLGYRPSTDTWYKFATSSVGNLDGISIPPFAPDKVIVQGDTSGDIELLNGNGTSAGVWGTSASTDSLIGAWSPLDQSYWVPQQNANLLWHFPAGGGAGVAVNIGGATPNFPTGLAFDNVGNLYITDPGNSRIVKVSAASLGNVTPTATVLSTGLLHIAGISFDGNNTLYTTGWYNNSPRDSKIYRVDMTTGVSQMINDTFGPLGENGGGPLYHSDGLALDLDGNIWTSQAQLSYVRKGIYQVSPSGVPLRFAQIPAVVGGTNVTSSGPDQIVVVGQLLPRVCGASAPVCPNTATTTPSPTAGASTYTATPSPTLSSTHTNSPTPSVTATSTGGVATTFTQTITPSVTATFTPTPGLSNTVVWTPTPVASMTCILIPRKSPGDDSPHKVIVRSKEGGRCGVRVYRPEGRACKRLFDGQLAINETKVLLWSADDEAGQRVASGIYLVVFQDGNGTLHKSKVAIIR